MGYELEMQSDVIALIDMFQTRIVDAESHQQVRDLVINEKEWLNAHDLFGVIRSKALTLDAEQTNGKKLAAQYAFLEVCLKAFFNETDTNAPFDPSSPYWISKNALILAETIGIPTSAVVGLLMSGDHLSTDVSMKPF